MQNKQRLELADYEAENLARLQKTFARKWEFVFMQAEAQAKSVASQSCVQEGRLTPSPISLSVGDQPLTSDTLHFSRNYLTTQARQIS